MKKISSGTILLTLSVLLVRYVILSRFGIALAAITLAHIGYKKSFKAAFLAVGDFFWQIAVAIDLLGNVLLQFVFNLLFTKGNYHAYGQIGETISSATGVNLQNGTLNFSGRLFAKTLDLFLGKNHCINSINKK